MGVDVIDDALDAFGNGRRRHVEVMRPRHANMRERLIDLEELQAVRGELLAKDRRNLEREAALVFPDAADQAHQVGAAQRARRGAVEGMRLHRLDDVLFVRLAEVLLHLFHGGHPERLGQVEADVFRLPALVIHPLLDDLLVAHDAHPRLVFLERHPGEAFGVQLAQLVLVVVVVGRAQDDAAHAALGDKGVLAFRRLGRRAFGLVERGEVLP